MISRYASTNIIIFLAPWSGILVFMDHVIKMFYFFEKYLFLNPGHQTIGLSIYLFRKEKVHVLPKIVKSMVPGSGDLVLRVRGSIPYTMMLTFFIIVKENEIKYILKITYFNVIFQK